MTMRHLSTLMLVAASACGSEPAVVSLDVGDVTIATLEDTPVSIALPVTGASPQIQVTLSTMPAHGTVTATADAMVWTYTPTRTYNGPDALGITFDNGTVQKTGTAHIMVAAVNDAPIANPDSFATPFDTTASFDDATLLANDTDVDSPVLTVVSVTPLDHGTATHAGTSTTFIPEAGYAGSATFSYTISDGQLTATAMVAVTIGANSPPVAVNDTVAGTEDTPVQIPVATLLANDSDPEHQTLEVSTVGQATHGTVARQGAMITFTPAANYNGVATFQYGVTDGADTSTATVAIDIAPVNDPPVVASVGGLVTAEDVALSIPASTLLAGATDVDGNALRVAAVKSAQHGSISMGSLAGDPVSFRPDPNYNGPAGFTFTITDGVASVDAMATITVTPVNDPPVAVDDVLATNEDTALTTPTAALLANDTDVDGDHLVVTAVSNATHGTASLAGTTIQYVPAANYNGPAGFDYTISDGQVTAKAHVAITVVGVNDPPVAHDDAIAIAEDTPGSVNVLTNDSDVDGDALSIASFAQGAHGMVAFAGGVATYTPSANYNGLDQFSYTVIDGHGGVATAIVHVTIAAVNDPPVVVDDALAIEEDTPGAVDVLANDSDVDGDSLSIVVFSQGAHGTVVFTGGVARYTPAANYNGLDQFTYTAADGHGGVATATVRVTIASVNDAPTAVADAATTLQNVAVAIAVLANDSDIDGGVLTIQTVTQPGHGTTAVVADKILYTPVASFSGSDSFSYTISDGQGGVSSATVTVTITPVNRPPVAVDDHYTTGQQSPLTVGAPGVLANDTDPDSVTLTAQLVSSPDCGTLALAANGSFTYTPGPSALGGGLCTSTSFTYRVSDGALTSNTATVTIALVPEAAADAYTYTDGADTNTMVCFDSLSTPSVYGCYNFESVLVNDGASPGATIVLDSPAGCVANGSTCVLTAGTLAVLETGTFDYYPTARCGAHETFSYHFVDGGVASASVTVTIALPCIAPVRAGTPPSAPVHASVSSR